MHYFAHVRKDDRISQVTQGPVVFDRADHRTVVISEEDFRRVRSAANLGRYCHMDGDTPCECPDLVIRGLELEVEVPAEMALTWSGPCTMSLNGKKFRAVGGITLELPYEGRYLLRVDDPAYHPAVYSILGVKK